MSAARQPRIREAIHPRRRNKSDGPFAVADIPNKEDQRDLKRSLLRLRDVKAMMDKLEEEKSKLTGEIGDILDASGIEQIRHLDIKVSRITSQRTTLKRELLLEQGIDPAIITRAEITKEYKYVKLEVDK